LEVIDKYLGNLQKAKQLKNLVEENPTYQQTTKRAVLQLKQNHEREIKNLTPKNLVEVTTLVNRKRKKTFKSFHFSLSSKRNF
jgi:hypothetical protein